jgi:uncharacterized protein (UPF0261 family)
MPKTIAIIGTLDTKGPEVAFLRDFVQARGHHPCVIDPGVLDTPAIPADITRQEVARAGGRELADLIASGDKGRAMQTMIDGARAVVARRYAEGKLDAVLAVGGGQGTAIGTAAMQALPIGVPKLMVSTITSGPRTFEPYVGTTDITLMHSVADIAGLNAVTIRVFTNAAAAIVGMAEVSGAIEKSRRRMIGTTMLGLTTPCVLHARACLEAWGYEVVTFHPNGTGGRCLERLVDEGLLQGVMDISLQELTGYICHGLFDAGPERMHAAARRGLPQVVTPGGTDYIVLGPKTSLTDDQRRRPSIIHNPNITLVRTSKDEMERVGQMMAQRLNAAAAPAAVMVPMRGFSYSDRPGHAFYDPDADAALVAALETSLEPRVELHKLDLHVNEAAFAEAVASKMREIMERQGSSLAEA